MSNAIPNLLDIKLQSNTQQPSSSRFPESILTVSQQELSKTQMIVDGVLPDDLSGHVFIMAPVGHVDSERIPDTSIVHPSKDGTPLFNGNGMIYRLDFDKARQVGLKSKIAKTPCYYADEATQSGTKYQEYGFRNFGLARLSPWLGVRNVVNTALLPMKFGDDNERLLVTCDVGRPYEIDTHSLEIVTPIGWNQEWRQQLPLNIPFEMVMNTAHPYFDAHTSEMFTVNYGKSLPTLLSSIVKPDVAKLPQVIKEILGKFAKFLEAPQDIKTLEIAKGIYDILKILNKEINQIPGFLKSLWQGLRQLLQQLLKEVIEGTALKRIDEVKQLVEIVKQMLEGLDKIDDFVYLIRWDGKSDIERWRIKLPDGSAVKIKHTMHQIGVTQDYVVLMDTGFKVGLEQLVTEPIIQNKKLENRNRELLDSPESSDETYLYIVRRADLKAGQRPASSQKEVEVVAQQVVIPEGVIHFVVDYENPHNQITLHVAHSCAWDVAEWLRDNNTTSKLNNSHRLQGMVSGPVDIHSLGRYVIDGEKGKLDPSQSKVISDRDLTWAVAIYTYNERAASKKFDNIYWNSWGCWEDLLSEFVVKLYENYPQRKLSLKEVREITKQGVPANICRLVADSKESMAIADRYKFPPGYFGNSVQFLPRTHSDGSSTDGYIACTVVSHKSEIWIFDAKDLAQGPLCKLSHPQLKFGFTTHTTWLPKIAPRTANYYIPVRKDFENLVNQQRAEIQKLFEEAVYPKFPLTAWPSVPDSITTASRCELSGIKLNILESKLPAKKLPDGLHGHVFIMGPVGSVDSGGLPHPNGDPIFNSDGMIYRLDFNRNGEVGLKTRIVKPPCYYADIATQLKTKYAKYRFRNFGISRFSPDLGSRNQLNTAFVPIYSQEEPDRLLVTCDAGRPYEIDTETLKVVTPVGSNKEWRPEIKLNFPFPPVLTTAHPAFDARTREVFTVNYGRSLFNFLETIPSIHKLDKFLDEVDEFLAKDVFKTFSQVSDKLLQIYNKFVSPDISPVPQDFVYLIRWDGVGHLERWKLVLPDGTRVQIKQSLHQIGITRDYVVLMDTDFKVGITQAFNNLFPSHKKVEELIRKLLTLPVLPDTTLYIVRRADLKAGQRPEVSHKEVEVVARKIVIPQAAIHFVSNYDNPDNQVTLYVTHNSADVAEWVRQNDNLASSPKTLVPPNLVGMLTSVTDISRLGRYVIDGESGEILDSKKLSDSRQTWGVGLYTYCDRLSTGLPSAQVENIYWQSSGFWQELCTKFIFDLYKDDKYRVVSPEELLHADSGRSRPSCLFRLDTKHMVIADAYEFPVISEDDKHWDSHMVLSPQFVPRADGDGSSTDGYIVCTVVSKDGDQIWIFDAKDLAQGPLCKLGHPSLNFSYTIHTAWLPKIAPRTAGYNCPVREDYQDQVEKNSQDIQDLFETEVYPYFEGNSPVV
ncbi:carotenoid oxygenase family protein [Scytonema sp. PCC 10023]|uniref:carotenoid oxygenase family protein n=1 Tax=Scytonema sp. PCC 10023 TaxID=1680591 RepID=UPI0039C6941D